MNNYNTDVEQLKAEFWERIRPRTKEELENERMIARVKEHYDILINQLLNESGVYTGTQPKAQVLEDIKEEMNSFIVTLKESK